jgi:hypothetical protein
MEMDADVVCLGDAGDDGMEAGFTPFFEQSFEQLFPEAASPAVFSDID